MIGEHTCRDFGERPGCLREPDPAFEMRFDDLGEPPIQWCSHCGPDAHALHRAIEKALRVDKTFAKRFEAAIGEAEASRKAGAS